MTRRSLVNATRKAINSGPGAADPAVREAAETVLAGDDGREVRRVIVRAPKLVDIVVCPPGRWVNPPIASGEQLGLVPDAGRDTPYLASTAWTHNTSRP